MAQVPENSKVNALKCSTSIIRINEAFNSAKERPVLQSTESAPLGWVFLLHVPVAPWTVTACLLVS